MAKREHDEDLELEESGENKRRKLSEEPKTTEENEIPDDVQDEEEPEDKHYNVNEEDHKNDNNNVTPSKRKHEDNPSDDDELAPGDIEETKRRKLCAEESQDYVNIKFDNSDKRKPEDNSLDEFDVKLLTTYGRGMYDESLKKTEEDIQGTMKRINDMIGIEEMDSGLAPLSMWDLRADAVAVHCQAPLLVARCSQIIDGDSNNPRYVVEVGHHVKFVVGLGDRVAAVDIDEGMRVGLDPYRLRIQLPLPPRIDPLVSLMEVEDKPEVTYADVGGCQEQVEKLREVVEEPLLHPEKFLQLGLEPPKGVLLYGPPGTGKTLCAKAVANRADACFIRVIATELVQKYIGEGARMVRELFELARSKSACVIFFDEIDAIGGSRSIQDGSGGDNEVQRTMLELINQLDGFDSRGNIKVLMATNRPDTLDPALVRPGRLDRKVEFGPPDLQGCAHIFRIHAKSMNVEKGIRYELLARLCPNTTGAEIRSVCTEAGMFAIRARQKVATERHFLQAIDKVVKGYKKFSATSLYLNYN